MKIILDVDRLLQEHSITREEYDRLKSLASQDTLSLALNVLIAFGVIAIAAGTLALLKSAAAAIPLGGILATLGIFLGLAHKERWGLLGLIMLMVGSLTAAGGIVILTKGSAEGFLVVTVLFTGASILAKSGLLSALSAFALLATIGGATGYGHAMYFLAIEQPTLTIVLFSILSLAAYRISLLVSLEYSRLAVIFSRTSLFIVNLGFWIGSLWGDDLWQRRGRLEPRNLPVIPDWVFVIGWAIALLTVGVWAARRNKRSVVNLVAVFGAIHFYTQWFERLGASPASVLVAGLVAIGIAVIIIQYNRSAKSEAAPPRGEPSEHDPRSLNSDD